MGNNWTSTFNSRKHGRHVFYNHSNNNAELKLTKAMYKHLISFYLTDWRHKHTYKSPKKRKEGPPLLAVESSSPDR